MQPSARHGLSQRHYPRPDGPGSGDTQIDSKQLGGAAKLLAAGAEFASMVVAGVIAGYYADQYIGTAPLFTLLLTLAGMGGALYRLIWTLKQSNSRPTHGG